MKPTLTVSRGCLVLSYSLTPLKCKDCYRVMATNAKQTGCFPIHSGSQIYHILSVDLLHCYFKAVIDVFITQHFERNSGYVLRVKHEPVGNGIIQLWHKKKKKISSLHQTYNCLYHLFSFLCCNPRSNIATCCGYMLPA